MRASDGGRGRRVLGKGMPHEAYMRHFKHTNSCVADGEDMGTIATRRDASSMPEGAASADVQGRISSVIDAYSRPKENLTHGLPSKQSN